MRNLFIYCCVLALIVTLSGCSTSSRDAVTGQDRLADLAWRYLNLEVDAEGAELINDEIRGLDREETRAFVGNLQILGNASEQEIALGNNLMEAAFAKNLHPFALAEADVVKALQEQLGIDSNGLICAPWESICAVWTPSSTTSLYGYNSTATGTTASWSDRASTENCEVGGCDHRFYFTGTKTLIDGKTTAYDNWIASYASILGEHTGTATHALMGNGQAILNGIYSVDYTQLKTY